MSSSIRFRNVQGFTLIELLVVIAIIGILAAIVLVSLSSARNKGGDGAVISDLHTIANAAELNATNNGYRYTNVCTDASVVLALNGAFVASGATTLNTNNANAGGAATVTCHAVAGGWAAESPLKTAGLFWCVDSTGTTTQRTSSTIGNSSDILCG